MLHPIQPPSEIPRFTGTHADATTTDTLAPVRIRWVRADHSWCWTSDPPVSTVSSEIGFECIRMPLSWPPFPRSEIRSPSGWRSTRSSPAPERTTLGSLGIGRPEAEPQPLFQQHGEVDKETGLWDPNLERWYGTQ